MRSKIYYLILGVAFVGLALGAAVARSVAAQGNPHRVIVTFDERVVNEDAELAIKNLGGNVVKPLPLIDGMVAILPNKAAEKALGSQAGVLRIERDAEVFALKPPGGCDPWPECKNEGDGEQLAETLEWGVDRIDAALAWTTNTGAGIDVAIIDTGIDKDHADLVNNLEGGVSFVSKQSWKWDDDNGHGTHVAGIVAAVDNEIGVVGVAPQANLWAVKVLDRTGSGYVSDVIDGITWSMNNGMEVVNMSLGSSSDVQALHEAVDAAYNAGLVLVAAAGNSGDGNGITNEVIYPAKYSTVIAVAATDRYDGTPSWSSEGEEVEVAAPGVSIRSTWNDGEYFTISGTSMASPHTAGVVALMLAANSNLSPDQVRSSLQLAADDLSIVGFNNFYGWGLVDAEESVASVQTE